MKILIRWVQKLYALMLITLLTTNPLTAAQISEPARKRAHLPATANTDAANAKLFHYIMHEAPNNGHSFGHIPGSRANTNGAPKDLQNEVFKFFHKKYRPSRTLIGHTNMILDVKYSPDGTKIVTGSTDKTAKIWDSSTGKCLATLNGHTNIPANFPPNALRGHTCMVAAVDFSPNGKLVLTGSKDSTAKVWNLAGHCLTTFIGHTDCVDGATFSPDGIHAATASYDGTTKIWNVLTGRCQLTITTPNVQSVCFNHDGTKFLTNLGNRLALWNTQDGKLLQSLDIMFGSQTQFSRNGTTILHVPGKGMVQLWDTQTGQVTPVAPGNREGAFSGRFNCDETYILVSDNDAKLLSINTGHVIQTFGIKTDRITNAEFNYNNTQIVTAGAVKGFATIWQQDLISEEEESIRKEQLASNLYKHLRNQILHPRKNLDNNF